MPTVEQVRQALTQVHDPELGRSIVELGMVRDIQIDAGHVHIVLALTIMGCPLRDYLQQATQQAAAGVSGVEEVTVKLTAMNEEERRQVMERMSPAMKSNRVGRIVAVMSGKGGVGKSSVTALLATALRREEYSVGVLDGDITGPSIPRLFGLRGPTDQNETGLLPAETTTGIKVMSANLLVDAEDTPIIWPSSRMAGAVKQFWTDVVWGELDYLLIDLPPETSDPVFTVMQALPLDGVLIVTTPQRLSAMVARKVVHTCQHMQAAIIGVIENMSFFTCPETGNRHEVFGPSHTDSVAKLSDAPLLGRLPLHSELTRLADAGQLEEYDHAAQAEMTAAFVEAVPASAQPTPAAPWMAEVV